MPNDGKVMATEAEANQLLVAISEILPTRTYEPREKRDPASPPKFHRNWLNPARSAISIWLAGGDDLNQAQVQILIHLFRGDYGLHLDLPEPANTITKEHSFSEQLQWLRRRAIQLQATTRRKPNHREFPCPRSPRSRFFRPPTTQHCPC